MTRRLALGAALVLTMAVAADAQLLDRAGVDRQLGRIFQDGAYDPPAFGPARWMADGTAYTTVETTPTGGTDLVRYDAATGARSVLVASARLVPAGATAPLALRDYAWSTDGTSSRHRFLLFFDIGAAD